MSLTTIKRSSYSFFVGTKPSGTGSNYANRVLGTTIETKSGGKIAISCRALKALVKRLAVRGSFDQITPHIVAG